MGREKAGRPPAYLYRRGRAARLSVTWARDALNAGDQQNKVCAREAGHRRVSYKPSARRLLKFPIPASSALTRLYIPRKHSAHPPHSNSSLTNTPQQLTLINMSGRGKGGKVRGLRRGAVVEQRA